MKNLDVFQKKKCRLCESKKLKTVYSLNDQPVGDDYLKNKKKNKNYIL